MKLLSIIVPCYNEENNIEKLADYLNEIRNRIKLLEIEVILVQNGSSDKTKDKIAAASEKYDFIKWVNIEVNEGYGNGILKGLEAASGDYLSWTHADLQIPADSFCTFEKLYSENTQNNKIVYKGTRKNRSFVDYFFTFGMGVYESLYLHARLFDINGQPTVIDRALYEEFVNPPKDFSLDLYTYYLAVKRGYKILRFPVTVGKRESGESSWNKSIFSRFKGALWVVGWSKNIKRMKIK